MAVDTEANPNHATRGPEGDFVVGLMKRVACGESNSERHDDVAENQLEPARRSAS